jgi:hypothetical protein
VDSDEEDAAVSQILAFRSSASFSASARVAQRRPVEQLSVPMDPDFDAPIAIIAKLARELPAVLADGPEVFASPGAKISEVRPLNERWRVW